MKKCLATLLLLVLSLPAFATTYYVSSCGPGAMPGCVEGSSANAGTDPAAPKRTAADVARLYGAAAAGDSILLAQGGAWGFATEMVGVSNRRGTKANPITIGSYAPPWVASCAGAGSLVAASASTLATGLAPELDAWAGCDVKVTSRVQGARYTQRYTIAGNTTAGVLTLAAYRDPMHHAVNTFEHIPSAADTYTIVGPAPLITATDLKPASTQKVFSFQTATPMQGLTLSGLHFESGQFKRVVSSATNTADTVITDATLGSRGGIGANQLSGREIILVGGTCYNPSYRYAITANTATTLTLRGVVFLNADGARGNLTFGAPLSGATGGTLVAAFAGATGSYVVQFSDDSQRVATLTHGATSVAWDGAVTATAKAVYGSLCTPDATTRYVVLGSIFTIAFYGDISDVTVDDVIVRGAQNGLNCLSNTPGTDPRDYVIKNSSFTGNQEAMLWACSDTVFENNLLAHNGSTLFDHAIYINHGAAGYPNRIHLRGNRISESDMEVGGVCNEAVIVVHGRVTGLFIEDNVLTEARSAPSCWAIGVGPGYGTGEGFRDVRVSGNYLANFGRGILVGLCDSCTIENNNIIQPDWTGIEYGMNVCHLHPADTIQRNAIIRNNTINLTAPSGQAEGIRIDRCSGDPPGGGGHRIHSNLIVMGATAPSDAHCFNFINVAAGEFAGVDYNVCYSAGAPAWSNLHGSLAAAQAAGLDVHSARADPGITVGPGPAFPMTITTASSAYRTGSPTNSSPQSIGGRRRGGAGAPSKGAHEPDAPTRGSGTPTAGEGQ